MQRGNGGGKMEQEEKAGGKAGEGVGDGDWMFVCRCVQTVCAHVGCSFMSLSTRSVKSFPQ